MIVRRLLPAGLVFAVVLAGLAVFAPRLRVLLGTDPASATWGAAAHDLYATGPVVNRCDLPANRDENPEATLRALAGCLDRAWARTMAQADREYEPPGEVNLIGSPAEAACGTDEYDWVGIYCPDTASVNVLMEDGKWVFASMFTLAHEYAHHVQEISGIASRRGPEAFDEAWTRRLELQANCMAAAALRGVDPAGVRVVRESVAEAAGAERDRGRAGATEGDADGGTDGDADGDADGGTDGGTEGATEQERTHGSAASETAWLLRGERHGTVGACNTWAAPAAEVS
ncbi:hypothetical protein Misp01_02630 [Microtetraspora sp. NBRC 13810]|uniref:neutral zinc metallopeptidase n=1 Tax=Microtetraspora sp. NBRC 13810 TaxID=3030990 RepID=UPI00249FB014|nr:neutral zinc metallopeptidase [Microtetraspora sp. NBRC 13810]GLW05133.1 hypothetical protein Misp01_02630 [Microtetraspora sp. NBRC 13810]